MKDESVSWQLAPHCCGSCFGRVLRANSPDGRHVFRCAQCGVCAEGGEPSVICCCGIRLKTGEDAGVRCVVNKTPSTECPLEVVAEQVSNH
jgi:hypothetical protein